MKRPQLWIVAALVLALGLFWLREQQLAGRAGFPLDDSWIHVHFARNLAEGRGFVYNPGVHVSGSTAPLWTLLLAGAFALGGSAPWLAKALGVAASVATALLTRALVCRWSGHEGLGLLAGLLAALSGPLAWGALSGMEVPLAALLVTGGLAAHAAGRDGSAAALLTGAVLARPESALVLPLVWASGRVTWRRTLVFGVSAVLMLSPWVAFNLVTTGAPLPATAVAKVEGGLVGFLAGGREPLSAALLDRPWRFLVEWVSWLVSVNLPLTVLVPLGWAFLWRRSGRRAALPVLVLVLHPIGMALLAPYRDPSFQEGRYSIHLLPLVIAVGTSALAIYRQRFFLQARGVAAVVLVGAALWTLGPAASRYGWAVQNINAMQVELGRWVAEHTPPGARVAVNDVGAIAFISRREVVDVMGLVTPAVIPYRREGEAGVLRYLRRTCPDYLVVFPTWFPRLTAMTEEFRPLHRVRLERNTVAGADEMVVYETSWNRWSAAPRPCGTPSGGLSLGPAPAGPGPVAGGVR